MLPVYVTKGRVVFCKKTDRRGVVLGHRLVRYTCKIHKIRWDDGTESEHYAADLRAVPKDSPGIKKSFKRSPQ